MSNSKFPRWFINDSWDGWILRFDRDDEASFVNGPFVGVFTMNTIDEISNNPDWRELTEDEVRGILGINQPIGNTFEKSKDT